MQPESGGQVKVNFDSICSFGTTNSLTAATCAQERGGIPVPAEVFDELKSWLLVSRSQHFFDEVRQRVVFLHIFKQIHCNDLCEKIAVVAHRVVIVVPEDVQERVRIVLLIELA